MLSPPSLSAGLSRKRAITNFDKEEVEFHLLLFPEPNWQKKSDLKIRLSIQFDREGMTTTEDLEKGKIYQARKREKGGGVRGGKEAQDGLKIFQSENHQSVDLPSELATKPTFTKVFTSWVLFQLEFF